MRKAETGRTKTSADSNIDTTEYYEDQEERILENEDPDQNYGRPHQAPTEALTSDALARHASEQAGQRREPNPEPANRGSSRRNVPQKPQSMAGSDRARAQPPHYPRQAQQQREPNLQPANHESLGRNTPHGPRSVAGNHLAQAQVPHHPQQAERFFEPDGGPNTNAVPSKRHPNKPRSTVAAGQAQPLDHPQQAEQLSIPIQEEPNHVAPSRNRPRRSQREVSGTRSQPPHDDQSYPRSNEPNPEYISLEEQEISYPQGSQAPSQVGSTSSQCQHGLQAFRLPGEGSHPTDHNRRLSQISPLHPLHVFKQPIRFSSTPEGHWESDRPLTWSSFYSDPYFEGSFPPIRFSRTPRGHWEPDRKLEWTEFYVDMSGLSKLSSSEDTESMASSYPDDLAEDAASVFSVGTQRSGTRSRASARSNHSASKPRGKAPSVAGSQKSTGQGSTASEDLYPDDMPDDAVSTMSGRTMRSSRRGDLPDEGMSVFSAGTQRSGARSQASGRSMHSASKSHGKAPSSVAGSQKSARQKLATNPWVKFAAGRK